MQEEDDDLLHAYKLVTKRETECIALLRELTGVRTVRLSPSAFAILAARGYGSDLVTDAVGHLVRAGLAELRWEVQGMKWLPVVAAA